MIGILLFIHQLLDGLSAGGAPSSSEPPEVYALIIGVSTYEDHHLPQLAENAARIVDRVRSTYPQASIDFFSERGSEDRLPTERAIRKVLYKRIRQLPARSLVVFYFTGHGVRSGETPGDGDLYLLLRNADLAEPWRDSITLKQVLDAIDEVRGGAAMILLDCCHSGARRLDLEHEAERFRSFGIRAFLLASSASEEQTRKGFFVQALIDSWDESPGDSEGLTPSELEAKVVTRTRELAGDSMIPELVFGHEIQERFVDLGEPSVILMALFPKGCAFRLDFKYDDSPRIDRYDRRRKFHVSRVPASTKTVRAIHQGVVVWEEDVASLERAGDFRWAEIEFKDESYHESTSTDPIVLDYQEVAEFLDGEPEGESFAWSQAARWSIRQDPSADVRRFLTRASDANPRDPLLRLAAGRVGMEDLSYLTLERDELLSRIRELERLGAYRQVAALSSFWIPAEQNAASGERGFFYFKAALNLRLAGEGVEESALIPGLERIGVSGPQERLINTVIAAKLPDLQSSLGVLPASLSEWVSIG